MSKNKSRKREKKYHLEHLIEAEAEMASHDQMGKSEKDKKEIIHNDIISKKTEILRKNQEKGQKNINKDVAFSIILTILILISIGVVYYFEDQNQFMSSLPKRLMDLILQR